MWGQVLMPKWWLPGKFTDEYPSVAPPPVSLSPHWTTAAPPLPMRPSKTSWQVWAPIKSLLLPLGPGMHETLHAPFKSKVSVSPSHMEHLHSSPTSLQNQIIWSQGQIPRLGILMWNLTLLLLQENFCDIIFHQFAGFLTGECGI